MRGFDSEALHCPRIKNIYLLVLMRDHVSAHGAEDPKELKGRRRLQREDSELSKTRGQGRKGSSFPGASQSLGPWNVDMPLNSFGPYHRIPGRG